MSTKPDTTLPPAVRPDVVCAPTAPSPETIERINTILSKPWNSYERRDGRIVDIKDVACGSDLTTHEAIVAYYEAAGWKVEKRSHQLEGEWFVISLAAASPPRNPSCACGAPSCDLCHP